MEQGFGKEFNYWIAKFRCRIRYL